MRTRGRPEYPRSLLDQRWRGSGAVTSWLSNATGAVPAGDVLNGRRTNPVAEARAASRSAWHALRLPSTGALSSSRLAARKVVWNDERREGNYQGAFVPVSRSAGDVRRRIVCSRRAAPAFVACARRRLPGHRCPCLCGVVLAAVLLPLVETLESGNRSTLARPRTALRDCSQAVDGQITTQAAPCK